MFPEVARSSLPYCGVISIMHRGWFHSGVCNSQWLFSHHYSSACHATLLSNSCKSDGFCFGTDAAVLILRLFSSKRVWLWHRCANIMVLMKSFNFSLICFLHLLNEDNDSTSFHRFVPRIHVLVYKVLFKPVCGKT